MFAPFIMQGRVDSPISPLSSLYTSLAGLHTSSVFHSRSTDRIPLYISTSDTPLWQWHARSPRLPEPAPARTQAPIHPTEWTVRLFHRLRSHSEASPARFFVFKVLFFNTLPPEISCLGASPNHEQKCFSVGNFSSTSLPTSSSPSVPATRQIHPPRSNPLR